MLEGEGEEPQESPDDAKRGICRFSGLNWQVEGSTSGRDCVGSMREGEGL